MVDENTPPASEPSAETPQAPLPDPNYVIPDPYGKVEADYKPQHSEIVRDKQQE